MARLVRPLFVVPVLILVAGCRTSRPPPGPEVRSLRIEGAKQVKEEDIKKRILTTQTGWIPLLSKPRYFEPEIWRLDLRRIERYYRARGYYQARVLEDEVVRHDGEVSLTVRVAEGPPTLVGRISVRGLEVLSPQQQEALLAGLRLEEGEVFREDLWELTKANLRDALQELGYAGAEVEGKVRVDLATLRADVSLRVEPGLRYRFGELRVEQSEGARVPAWRILEQVSAAAQPGDWYSDSALEDAQSRIFRLGVFGAVKIRPGELNPREGTVPLVVDVEEAPFHLIRAGGGVGVDQARNELRLTGEYIHRNFLGSLRRLTVEGLGGWALLPGAYSSVKGDLGRRSGPIARLSAGLEQPRLFVRDLSLAGRLEVEQGIEPAYSFRGGRARVGLIWRPTLSLAISGSYNFELYRLDEGELILTGTTPELLFSCPQSCMLSYVEERVAWDRRDNRLEPRSGYYLALSLQQGGGILGGSFQYFRIQPEARGYVSFLEGRRLTLAARVRVGTLLPATGSALDSPIVARFYSGGDWMRGFGTRRLAPLQVVEAPGRGDVLNVVTVPVGGNGLFESSLELRYALDGGMVVATFLDAGFVSPESIRPSSFREMQYAVGVGIRFRTAAGPIRLDVAYRPNVGPPLRVYQPPGATLTYPSQGGCFGIGGGRTGAGAPEDPCSLHVSIGEAF